TTGPPPTGLRLTRRCLNRKSDLLPVRRGRTLRARTLRSDWRRQVHAAWLSRSLACLSLRGRVQPFLRIRVASASIALGVGCRAEGWYWRGDTTRRPVES